jgi:hypothetical protein
MSALVWCVHYRAVTLVTNARQQDSPYAVYHSGELIPEVWYLGQTSERASSVVHSIENITRQSHAVLDRFPCVIFSVDSCEESPPSPEKAARDVYCGLIKA